MASILMNLYTLAGALRVKMMVPRYLPSAAVARKRLVDKMEDADLERARVRVVEEEVGERVNGWGGERRPRHRRWADVYCEYLSIIDGMLGMGANRRCSICVLVGVDGYCGGVGGDSDLYEGNLWGDGAGCDELLMY